MSDLSLKTLLVVEDNPGDARLLRELLSEPGSPELVFSHVERMGDAEKHLASNPVDIILLDLGLPDAQGLEAVRRARAAGPRIPLIVLTGLDDESLAAQTLQEGAQDYLIKGQIEIKGLLRAMRHAVERKLIERQRDEFEFQFHRSQRQEALGTLAGGIAHDLNNALVPVIGLTQLTMNRLPEGRDRANLALILEGGLRAASLVRQILSFSRMEPQTRQTVDLAPLVRNSLKMLRSTLPATLVIVDAIRPVPLVSADPGQIYQIVMNLVVNAAQAIGDHLGTMTVTLASLPPSASSGDIAAVPQVMLSVADNGCGMDEGTKARLFEPFFTTKAVGEGTGLGLSVVHGIVLGHGGRIQVESTLGVGTRFDISLPAIAAGEPRKAA